MDRSGEKQTFKMSKFFTPLALLFCISLQFALISAQDSPISAQDNQTSAQYNVDALPPSTSSLTGDALIQKACQGDSECASILQKAAANQKADANGLIFFSLRYAEDQAANFTAAITALNQKPDAVPMVQAALSDCIDQLDPVPDLIEDAINAVFAGVYKDAIKFVEAAGGDVDTCSTLLKNRIVDKSDSMVHVELPDDVLVRGGYLRVSLSAALNLLKA